MFPFFTEAYISFSAFKSHLENIFVQKVLLVSFFAIVWLDLPENDMLFMPVRSGLFMFFLNHVHDL